MLNKEDLVVFETALKIISEPIILVNEQLKINIINSAAEEIFGYKEEELLNRSLKLLIPEKHNEEIKNFFKSLLIVDKTNNLNKTKHLFISHKSGEIIPVKFTNLNPIVIKEKKYILSVILNRELSDKEDLQKLEDNVKERTRTLSETVEKLEKMNQQLDKENKKRIEAENTAREALKKERELNELKTKFLSMVSHEFKTPLTGISISTMLLDKYTLTEQQDKRDKHLSVINSKVHYLNSIINNFLSIEKLEKNEINYNIKPILLKNIIDSVIDGSEILLKKGQNIVCISNIDRLEIEHDEKIIELTIDNLLSNAIKYSRENTEIVIDINQDKKYTTIKVIDKGFGIPKKEQKNIFKRYYRADNVLLFEGTGIGLNIIKNHIENIGGTITFESELNKGSTFTVIIPNKMK